MWRSKISLGRLVSTSKVTRRPMRKAWSILRTRYGTHTVPCSDSTTRRFGEPFEQTVEDEGGHGLHRRTIAPVVQPLEGVVVEVARTRVFAPLRAGLRVLGPSQVGSERDIRLVEPRPEGVEVGVGG